MPQYGRAYRVSVRAPGTICRPLGNALCLLLDIIDLENGWHHAPDTL